MLKRIKMMFRIRQQLPLIKYKEKQYYVYGRGKLQLYEIAGKCYPKGRFRYGGVVVDQSQSYIWERGNRDLNYTINHLGYGSTD